MKRMRVWGLVLSTGLAAAMVVLFLLLLMPARADAGVLRSLASFSPRYRGRVGEAAGVGSPPARLVGMSASYKTVSLIGPDLFERVQLLQSGGFEGNPQIVFTHWSAGEAGAYQRTGYLQYEGDFSMRLHASLGEYPCMQNSYAPYLYQEIQVPSEVYSITHITVEGYRAVAGSLSPCSYPDSPDADDFLYVQLRDEEGMSISDPVTITHGGVATETWERFSVDFTGVDLTSLAGQTIQVYFYATHDQDFYGTFFYLDNLECHIWTHWPPPSPPPSTTLTYTVFLRNNSEVTATVIVTDPIPVHTAYVSGSARVSDGGAVTVENGYLRWSGQVMSGTPVVVEFAVEVPPSWAGVPITNTAFISDRVSGAITVEVGTTYDPGYQLIISEGSPYTNDPLATLRYAWDVRDGITHVRFSSDRSFGPGSNTTDWIPVRPTHPVYEGWDLTACMDPLCTVYAEFRDGDGHLYGPIRDTIVYDPNPPQVTEVEIITGTAQGIRSVQGWDVTVRVSATDDNSGVRSVRVSHSASFDSYAEFPVTGPTTDVRWKLQPSGEVYICVVDRAGNISSVVSEQGPPHWEMYLPLILKNG